MVVRIPPPPRSAVSFRSVLLGLAGTIFICTLTPYNDYALNNTFLVGNNLPLGLMVLTLLFVVLINAPLNRWAPRAAFTTGEMAVAFGMILVACALPSSGLMRYLPGSMIAPYHMSQANHSYRAMLESMNLPDWIWPSMQGDTVEQRMNDPVVTGYVGRWTDESPYPFRAWLVPMMTWGIFLTALFGALICMVLLVRRQWYENERLPFPLVQIQLSLIEAPAPGRFFNNTLAARSFWIAFALVLLLRVWNGCGEYWPQFFPTIPLGYDFRELMTERPLSFTYWYFKVANIYLIVIGATYFLSSQVAFSLWIFFVFDQIYRMFLGSTTGDPTHHGSWDEHFGGVLAFALAILWIGRRHWRLILAQAFRGARPDEPRGEYLSYPVAFWGLVICAAGMCTWLVVVGVSIIGAVVVIGLLLVLFLIITRIIAETGLVYGQLLVPLYKPWQLLHLYGWSKPVSMETFYMTAVLQNNFYDFREPLTVYASHAVKLNDQTSFPRDADDAQRRRIGRRILAVLVLALVVAYPVSFISTLWTNYRFASTQDIIEQTPINLWGTTGAPERYLLIPSEQYHRSGGQVVHSPLAHMGAGFGITAALAALRLHFAWWPLHPIGYLMYPTTPIEVMWFSIMLGWICKVLIVRFGGSSLYLKARPFFVGLILGECAAAAIWLAMGIILSTAGLPYRAINTMPA